jgi:hypothetical protein
VWRRLICHCWRVLWKSKYVRTRSQTVFTFFADSNIFSREAIWLDNDCRWRLVADVLLFQNPGWGLRMRKWPTNLQNHLLRSSKKSFSKLILLYTPTPRAHELKITNDWTHSWALESTDSYEPLGPVDLNWHSYVWIRKTYHTGFGPLIVGGFDVAWIHLRDPCRTP